MGFSSLDNIFSSISSGNSFYSFYSKTLPALSILSGWNDAFTFPGIPSAGNYNNNLGSCTTLSDTSDGAIYTGGNVLPATKHLLNIEAFCTHTSQSLYLLLVDMLAYYVLDINLPYQSFDTIGNILPLRNGVQHSGENVQMYLAHFGSGGSNISIQMNYTNSLGASCQPLGAPAITQSATYPGLFNYAPGSQNAFGPFLPHGVGNIGVQSVQNIKASAGIINSGVLVLCEPIAAIQLNTGGVLPCQKDFLFSKTRLPMIKDGACLNFLVYSTGTISIAPIVATMDFVWG